MPRVRPELAVARGYTIDTSCYPNVAYKGPRFNPTEWVPVFTDVENQLIKKVEALGGETGIPDASQDFELAEA